MNRIYKKLFMLSLLLVVICAISGCGPLSSATKDDTTTETQTLIDNSAEESPKVIIAATTATKEPTQDETVTKESTNAIGTEEPAKETSATEAPATEAPVIQSTTKEALKTESSTSESPEETKAPAKEETEPQSIVTISVTGDEKKGVILKPTSVEWQDGDSVLDVLKQVTKKNKIPLEYKGSGMLSYVEGIGNLYEFDQGSSSGWLFKVNGKFSAKSAGAVKLSIGDNVEWIYSIELSEEPIEEE